MSTPPTVHLQASDLRDLLIPVLPLASRSLSEPPTIAAVLIEAAGDYVTATATDRIRLGVCRHKPDTPPDPGFTALLDATALRRILGIFKPTRHDDPALTLTLTDDGVTIAQDGTLDGLGSTTVTLGITSGQYPDAVKSLLIDALKPYPGRVATSASLNPHLLSDFRHADRGDKRIDVHLGPPNRPVLVTCGDHFIGLIMPRMVAATDAPDQWRELLAPDRAEGGAA